MLNAQAVANIFYPFKSFLLQSLAKVNHGSTRGSFPDSIVEHIFVTNVGYFSIPVMFKHYVAYNVFAPSRYHMNFVVSTRIFENAFICSS